MARQSQLLRGVFPALFHPLPAPVWADDVDNRVNFGMNIGLCVCVSSCSSFQCPSDVVHSLVCDGAPLLTLLLTRPPGKARGFFKTGDMVIVVTGWIPGSGHTNIMRAVSAE